jgi:hypothetical protein
MRFISASRSDVTEPKLRETPWYRLCRRGRAGEATVAQ